MKIFGRSETASLLERCDLVAALEAAYLSGVEAPERLRADIPMQNGEEETTLLVSPAWVAGEGIGVKVVTVVPGNARRGLLSVAGAYLYLDGDTGQPLAMFDGAVLTSMRTAAMSALASRHLSRHESRRHLVVGAGALAPDFIRAHRQVRPIETTLIWARRQGEAAQLAEDMRESGLAVEAVDDLEAAVRRADIVSCVTSARAPVLQGAWFGPGMHLDLAGSYRRDMREADDEAIRRSAIFVDSLKSAPTESGELSDPIARGVIGPNDIRGDLAGLCAGRITGRRDEDEITLFKSVGNGLADFAAARAAWSAYKKTLAGAPPPGTAKRS